MRNKPSRPSLHKVALDARYHFFREAVQESRHIGGSGGIVLSNMESDEDSWMEEFHDKMQTEENERLLDRITQLTIEAEEATKRSESMKLEVEKLRAERRNTERERLTDRDGVTKPETHSLIQTPTGYGRATASDREVFIRKQSRSEKDDSDSSSEDDRALTLKSKRPQSKKRFANPFRNTQAERMETEMSRLEQERDEYQQNMEEMQQFMLNNMVPASSARRRSSTDYATATKSGREKKLRRNVGCGTDDEERDDNRVGVSKQSERPVPAPRRNLQIQVASSKSKEQGTSKKVVRCRVNRTEKDHKESKTDEATDTDPAESDEEGSNPSAVPWPLKREKRVTGKEVVQNRIEQPRRKQITPESFKGDVHLEEYLGQFESCATWNGWSESQKAQQLFMCLRGRARGVIRHKDEWKKITYKELVGRLEAMFSGQSELYLAQLRGRQQQQQESLQDFAQAVIKLTDNAYVGMSEEARNRIARDHFMGNLRDREIRSAIHLSRPKSMEEAIRTALETEAFLTAEKQRNPVRYTRVIEAKELEREPQMKEMLSLLQQVVDQLGKKKSDVQTNRAEQNPGPTNGGRSSGRNWRSKSQQQYIPRCYKCQSADHFIAECPKWLENGEAKKTGTHSGNEDRPNLGAGERSQTSNQAPAPLAKQK